MLTAAAAPTTAAPNEPAVPTTPAQPGTNEVQAPEDQQQPGTTEPQQGQTPSQPGVTTPQPGTTSPQPGVTTPNPNAPKPEQGGQGGQAAPRQPGVTAPRVAPLPVPGQGNQEAPQPAVVPGQPGPNGSQTDQLKPEQPQPEPSQVAPRPAQPGQGGQSGQGGNGQGSLDTLTDNGPAPQAEPRWNAPSLQAAPAAPVVPMAGPHTEVGANIDGGGLVPGYVANTHHFSNLDGYVGTVGYSTPTGTGDGGVSVEYVEANKIKLTTYTHTTGIDDLKSATGFADVTNETYIDTTQANAAKAAVEGWIRMQPGGQAAIDAAAQIGRLPEGEFAPQTVNVVGVTTQWSGSVQN
ncbi:hypothetical protein IU476_13560 [Nocardia blacklockiae]|nr:hypothetical protein [Nocardia blacklockiae]